ncbi:MAG: VCBS repeat-containing protein [Nannocystaceae bacterium]
MGPRPSFKETRLDTGTGNNLVATGVAIGLIDRDEHPDLVISSSMSTSNDVATPTVMTVRRGDGSGGLLDRLPPVEVGLGHLPVTLADVDGDGRHDIAMSGAFCLTRASGACDVPSSSPIPGGGFGTWGYVNDDEHVDVVAPRDNGEVLTHLGRSGIDFDEPIHNEYTGPTLPWRVLGDVDGDGNADIVGLHVSYLDGGPDAETPPGSIQVLTGDGQGHFSWRAEWTRELSERTGHLAGGDFNCDGLLDIVTTVSDPDEPTELINNKVHIYLSGQDTWHAPISIELDGPVRVAVGDFNADGHHDLVVATFYFARGAPPSAGYPVVLLGDGTGEFDHAQIALMSSGPSSNPFFVGAGDLNNDGLDDVLAADMVYTNSVSLWLSQSGG